MITYTGLMQACVDSGDVENAAYIFSHMQKFCSPNLVTCNIMLKAFLDHGKFEDAKQLFLTLLDNGNNIRREEDYRVRVIPDIYTFNTMLDACAAEKRWDDFEFVYTQMLRYGHHFNAKRHLRLILEAQRAGKVFHYINQHEFSSQFMFISCICVKPRAHVGRARGLVIDICSRIYECLNLHFLRLVAVCFSRNRFWR